MKTMNNAVTLGGRIGSDIVLRELGDRKCMTRISLATREFFPDKSGVGKAVTEWHRLVAWDSCARRMQTNLSKGAFVIVHGRLINRKYLDRNGKTQYLTEIVVREFSFQKKETLASQEAA